MGVRPGYKQTEVGVIPEDWQLSPVGLMGEVVTGKALAIHAPGKQRPYLRTKNVFDGRIDIDNVLTMPMTDSQFKQFMVNDGDVLLNEGQSLDLVGRCALYKGEYPEPCAIQNQLLRFRAGPGVSGVYASHLFRYCQKTGVFSRVALQTTSIAHLGGKRFAQLLLPWPPTEAEQLAIAAALADADALITSLGQLIAKERDVKQGAMQELLTGKRRLPGFEGNWDSLSLGTVVSIRKERYYPGMGDQDLFCIELENIVPNSGQINGSTLLSPGSSMKAVFHRGDVLFGKLRAYLRKYWLADREGVCSTEIWPLIADSENLEAKYLFQYIQTDDFIEAASMAYGTHMPRTDWNVVKDLIVSIPPLPEQNAIASALSEMDAEIAALEARREKTKQIKQGMMQELLTGRIRLV